MVRWISTGLAISCTLHVNRKGFIEQTLQVTLYVVLDSCLILNLMCLFITSRVWFLLPSANLGQFQVLTISVSCSYYHFPHLFTLYIEYRNTTFCMKFVSPKEGGITSVFYQSRNIAVTVLYIILDKMDNLFKWGTV